MIQQQDPGSQKKKIKLFLKLKIMLPWLHLQNRFSINQAVSGTFLSNEIFYIYFKCDVDMSSSTTCIAKLREMKKLQFK